MLSEVRKHEVKVILSLVNNYDSFGGKKQYVNWARAQGQAIGSDDEFFTNAVVKGFYKNHVKVNMNKLILSNFQRVVRYKLAPY